VLPSLESRILASVSTTIANTIKNAIKPMTTALCEMIVEQHNLYSESALGSETKSDRNKTFRQDLLLSLKHDSKKPRLYPCMITGECGDSDCVVAAHIVPARSKLKNLRNIGLTKEDVESSRNGLLLSKGIENAFDSLQLSFIKSPVSDEIGLLREGFVMKIWDDNCRDTFIWRGSNKRIGDYDGHQLLLGGHKPLKRALSNQAYTAFLHFRNDVLNITSLPPSEFGTDNESKYYKHRKLLKDNLARDLTEEIDDSNDDEGDFDDVDVSLP
jgi:hypothetical protein